MSDLVDLILELGSDATHGYGPRPIPCSMDDRVEELIASIGAMDEDRRSIALGNMDLTHGRVLLAFSERMSSFAVRTWRDEWIAKSLAALALGDKLIGDSRETLLTLSLWYRSTQKLGSDARGFVFNPSSVFDPRFVELVKGYLNRSPIDHSIEAMGFVEDSDADGFRYKRTW